MYRSAIIQKPSKHLFSARVIEMLKERKVYLIIRELERKNATAAPIDFKLLISTLLERNRFSLPWMTFTDEAEVRRVFQSLVPQYALHEHYSLGNYSVNGVKTVPVGDTHFSLLYFWNKWIDAVGFWKIIGLVSFIPNGFASKLIDLILALLPR